MKKISILLLIICLPVLCYCQITKADEFFKDVQVYNGKVVFIKEIKPATFNLDRNYFIAKEWAKVNFSKDPFNSSVSNDDKEKRIIGRSRVELLLAENAKSIREKIMMKYKIEIFFSGDYCIVEISDVNFVNDARVNGNTLKQKVKAEDAITDQAIAIQDENTETRDNIRKNAIYYFNDLVNSLQVVLSK